MEFYSITFFECPLDDKHENVFDGYNDVIEYVNKLLEIYSYHSTASNYTARRIENGNISTVVKMKYEIIENCSYAVINKSDNPNNPNYEAFFVVSKKSLNDSTLNSTTQVELKEDVFVKWHNLLFNSASSNDINYIKRRHYEDFAVPKLIDGEYKLFTNTFLSNEGEVKTTGSAKTIQKPLWYRVRVSGETYFAPSDLSFRDEQYATGVITTAVSAPVVYIPFCVASITGNYVAIDYSIYGCGFWNHGNFLTIWEFMDGNNDAKGIYFNTENILSVELTFYSPIGYYIDNVNHRMLIGRWDEGEFHGDNNTNDLSGTDSSATPNKNWIRYAFDTNNDVSLSNSLFYKSIPEGFTPEVAYSVPAIVWSGTDGSYEKYIDLKEFVDDDGTTLIQALSSKSIGKIINYEARMLKYPYKYKSVFINGEERVLLPNDSDSTEYRLYIQWISSPHPRCTLTLDDKVSMPLTTLKTNGECVVTIDSKEYFMRNNGNKIISDVLSSVTGAVGSIGSFAAGKKIKTRNGNLTKAFTRGLQQRSIAGGTDTFSTINQNISNIRDADNAADVVKNVDIDALDDLKQDLITEIDYEIVNKSLYKTVLYDIHYFGENVDLIESVKNNYHMNFDYVETIECNLNFVPNIGDRNEIEFAYNRGLTRWHMNNINENNSFDMSVFNKNLLNLSKNAYKAIEYWRA